MEKAHVRWREVLPGDSQCLTRALRQLGVPLDPTRFPAGPYNAHGCMERVPGLALSSVERLATDGCYVLTSRPPPGCVEGHAVAIAVVDAIVHNLEDETWYEVHEFMCALNPAMHTLFRVQMTAPGSDPGLSAPVAALGGL